jgi:hypothetical protein
MAISDFLTDFLNIGIETGYFTLSKIKNLDKTCCTDSEIEVIDFDATKEKIVALGKLKTIKSCDALIINAEKERIDFIEMKGFQKMILYSKNKADSKKLKAEFEEKVKKFNFIGKIDDSIFILNMLYRLNKFNLADGKGKPLLDVNKHLIILTDVSSETNAIERIAVDLLFLENFSTPIETLILNIVSTELDKTHKYLAHNFQQPILMTCNDIDAYYASI